MNQLSRTAIIISSLLCVSVAYAAPNSANHPTNAAGDAERQAKLNQPFAGAPVAPQATLSYSNTTVGGPSWARPFADCTGLSGLGPVKYHAQSFFVSTSGAYSVSSAQNGFDGYMFIYAGSFNPAAPNTGCIIGNDDGAGGIGTSDFTTNLVAGNVYVVVTTGFAAGDEGPFTNTINGPGQISLGTPQPAVFLPVPATGLLGLLALMASLIGFAWFRMRKIA